MTTLSRPTPLSALARRLIAGQLFIGISYGLTIPTWFLYLGEVRHFGPMIAGLSFALRAVGQVVLAAPAGWLIDRYGPRGVILVGTVSTVTGALVLGFSPWPAPTLVGSLLLGAGVALTTPATRSVLLSTVAPEERTRAATASFTCWILGLGGGGLIGGFVADPHRTVTFTVLFVLMAALGVATRLVNLPAIPRRSCDGIRPIASGKRGRGAPAFGWYLVLAFTIEFVGYGQSFSGLPGLSTTVLGVSPRTIGAAQAANTAIILLTSPVIRRLVVRWRRTTALSLVGLLWAGGWGLIEIGAITRHPGLTSALVIVFYTVFGVGEVLLAATSTPLIADLAPPGSLGRYLGMDTLTRQLGGALGPAMSGAFLSAGAVLPYLNVGLAVCLSVPVLAVILRRVLTGSQDMIPTVGTPRPVPSHAHD